MNKLIFIASIILLSACDNSSPKKAAFDFLKPQSLCIDGLAFATIHNGNGNALTQIFEPATSPNNPAQPRTCKDQDDINHPFTRLKGLTAHHRFKKNRTTRFYLDPAPP